MSIRPVDMQVILPKTAEANQHQGHESARGALQNQQFAQQMQKQVEADMQQVVQMSKSEKKEVDKDGSNKNGGQNKKRRTAQEQTKSKQQKKDKEGMFDISI